jgi:6-phosphogluconolactonase
VALDRASNFHEYASRDEAGRAIAEHVALLLRAGIRRRGRAAMIASGGESPRVLYALLREEDVAWDRVAVVPSDERCVAPNDPASNAGMLRATLLTSGAAAAALVELFDTDLPGAEGLARTAGALASLPRPFNVVVLGLGEDGHTASLFPDSPDIDRALAGEDVLVVQHVPRLPQARVSLTPRVLLDADEIILLFFGDGKREVYERALEDGPAAELPVRAVLQQASVPVTAYWAP